ncbi:MAG: hypothetical protein GW778_01250 [Alphaproteobacteria bacterium]|nr:hypothetical protein [Alphaproteobacteria bacterium]
MLAVLKSKSNKTGASASVVDGKLILSFPQAQTPVLWQMDLTQAKSSALEVLKDGKGSEFSLTLKTQKGEQVKIASFESRDEALEGLMAAADALKSAHGNIYTAANEDQKITYTNAPKQKSGKGKWITGIVALFALFILFGIWSMTIPTPPSSIQTTSAASNTSAQSPATSAAQSAGVPVSADDFLSGQ